MASPRWEPGSPNKGHQLLLGSIIPFEVQSGLCWPHREATRPLAWGIKFWEHHAGFLRSSEPLEQAEANVQLRTLSGGKRLASREVELCIRKGPFASLIFWLCRGILGV